MTYLRLPSIAFAAVSLLLVPHSASAQILQNGGFELPLLSSGASAAQVPTDWTGSGITIVSNGNGSFGNTPYGSQFVDLGAGGTLTQTISGFAANQTYFLGFDYEYQAGTESDSFTVSVSGAANTSTSYTLTGGGSEGTNPIPFQSTALVFTTNSSGSATFTFSDLGAAVALDNVGLYGNIVAPVDSPEPSTYAEMFLGLVALAGLGPDAPPSRPGLRPRRRFLGAAAGDNSSPAAQKQRFPFRPPAARLVVWPWSLSSPAVRAASARFSRALTTRFAQEWARHHPQDTIRLRDLGHHPVPHVTETWIVGASAGPESQTGASREAIAISDKLIDEFLAADRYVIGVPMYNFNIRPRSRPGSTRSCARARPSPWARPAPRGW